MISLERINDILGYKNRRIYQDDKFLSFSLDSVILANYSTIRKKDTNILDLCSGNGVVPLIMSLRTDKKIIGVEIQEDLVKLANKSIKLNKLDNQISMKCIDIKDFITKDRYDSYDLITCNPPYFNNYDRVNLSYEKKIARHEILINLEDVVSISSKLLKNGGTLCLVHRPERIIEIINLFNKYNISISHIKFIYDKIDKPAVSILIEGRKNRKCSLKIDKPLILKNSDGSYSDEYNKLIVDVVK